ncbi:PLDc N-terminal domain-containing protein, partial [Halomonas sp. 707D4]
MTSWLIGTSIMLIHLMGIVSAIMALMSSRTSQGAVAWIVSLMTFPYIALPAYWFFGRPRFYGYVTARGAKDNVLRRVLRRYRNNMKPHISLPATPDVQAVEQLAMMPLTKGNHAELLIDGQAT